MFEYFIGHITQCFIDAHKTHEGINMHKPNREYALNERGPLMCINHRKDIDDKIDMLFKTKTVIRLGTDGNKYVMLIKEDLKEIVIEDLKEIVIAV